ncbi:MAG: hypothetical protein HY898_11060 [Deltaproteobacteria bacterium]|nr:hypothetical protein [Deltaproteobacteria bacterium]
MARSRFLLSKLLAPTLIASGLCLVTAFASAQDKKNDEPCVPGKPCAAATPDPPAKKPVHHRAAKAHAAKHKVDGPLAVWPGFRMLPNGGSEVVVQLNRTVQPQVIKGPSTLTYILPGFHVPVHNNTHSLMTQYFNTPVADARLTQTKDDVRLTIVLRSPAEPKVHLTENDGGKSFELQIEFPKGDYHPEIHDMHGPNNEYHKADRGHAPEPGPPPPMKPKRSRASRAPHGPPAP